MAAETPSVDVTVRESSYKVQTLNQQDLDRNFCLATTNILKWMQAARMDFPWMQAGYTGLSKVEPPAPRRMLMASQMVRLERPGILSEAVGHEVLVQCEVGTIGKSSVEFRYQIFFDERLAGTAVCTMIVVSGTPGNFKPSPVPDPLRRLAATEVSADQTALTQSLATISKQPVEGAYVYGFTIRYSDEDVNKHANHSATARFFDDAKETVAYDESADPALRAAARQQLQAIMVTYGAETRAGDQCEVRVTLAEPGVLDLWVFRVAPNSWGGQAGVVSRGRLVCGDAEQQQPTKKARL